MNKYLIYIGEKIKEFLSKKWAFIRKWILNKIEEKETIEMNLRQDILTEEEFNELDEAGFAMARRFRLTLLRKASILGSKDVGKEGQEVHGWMQIIFKNRYAWLHDNGVFDRAINYALEYYNPEIFNVIKDYDFDNAIVNVMILQEKTWYDEFPEFKFDKIIILTQGNTFENIVTWQENVERLDENEYPIKKTIANCNFLFLGLTLWDKPVVVLKDAAGMGKLFFECKYNVTQMENMQEQILKMHIYSKRQEERTMGEKLSEKDIKYDKLKEEHQYFLDSIKAGDTRDPEEKLKNFAEKYDDRIYKKHINWKRIGVIIVAIVVVVGAMYFLSRFT